MAIPLLNLAPNIKDDGRCVNFAERPRIEWRFLGQDTRAEFFYALQFSRQINNRLPTRDLIRHLTADPLHRAKLSPFRRKNSLWSFKNLEQLAQTHRPDGRQHVERDAGFSGIHWRRGKPVYHVRRDRQGFRAATTPLSGSALVSSAWRYRLDIANFQKTVAARRRNQHSGACALPERAYRHAVRNEGVGARTGSRRRPDRSDPRPSAADSSVPPR